MLFPKFPNVPACILKTEASPCSGLEECRLQRQIDLVHTLSVNCQPTTQSYLFTEEITYFLSSSDLYLFVLLHSSLQKRGYNSSQRWRTEDSRPVRESRVCLWEGNSPGLIYCACDMGPVRRGGGRIQCSVSLTASCGTVIVLVICS